jgi:hypothetical protein
MGHPTGYKTFLDGYIKAKEAVSCNGEQLSFFADQRTKYTSVQPLV